MKLLFLFELIGLLSISLLVYPQIELIASGSPLPERNTLVQSLQQDNPDLLLAQTEFEDQTISFYYNPNQLFDKGIYYSSGLGKNYSFQQNSVHNEDYTIYFFADFGCQLEFMADGQILQPVEILEIKTEDIFEEIAIYHLHADQNILRKYKGKENYTSFCEVSQNCRDTVYTDLEELYLMIRPWIKMDEKDINKHGKEFEHIVSIQDNWLEHHVPSGYAETHSIEISFLQTIGSYYYLKFKTDTETVYYQISKSQLDQFNDFLNQ